MSPIRSLLMPRSIIRGGGLPNPPASRPGYRRCFVHSTMQPAPLLPPEKLVPAQLSRRHFLHFRGCAIHVTALPPECCSAGPSGGSVDAILAVVRGACGGTMASAGTESGRLRIFISYSRKDEDFAQDLFAETRLAIAPASF